MLKKLTATGVLAFAVTGAAMAAAGPASADGGINSVGNGGVLSGNQVVVPITVCGNAINVVNVLPNAIAACDAGGKGSHKHH